LESKKTKTITVIEKTRAREIPGEEARCLEMFAMITLTVIEKTLARELHRIAYQNASFTICDISTRSAKLVLPLLVSIAMCASHVAPNAVVLACPNRWRLETGLSTKPMLQKCATASHEALVVHAIVIVPL